jgi:uncharacterized repeat protein (TIGR03803 family)
MTKLNVWTRAFSGLLLSTAMTIVSPAQTFKTLGSFDETNGANPFMSPVQGADGDLYGTTPQGGLFDLCDGGCGTIFRVTHGGGLTAVYSFCAQPDCTDGLLPPQVWC